MSIVSRTLAIAITIGVGLLAISPVAHAQIVNVQSLLTANPTPGLSGSVKGSVNYRTGNIDLLRLSTTGSLAYQVGHHRTVVIGRGDFGETSGTRFIAKTFGHVRYRYFASDLFLIESFAQHEYDQFRRLSTRGLLGVGPAIRPIRGKTANLTIGIAYMFELERLRDDMEIDAEDTNTFHRNSSYATFAIELEKKIQFVQTFYIQPRFDAPSDVRLLSESQFVFKVTDKLSTTTAFSYAYDTRTPAAIEKQDTNLSSAIQYSF